MEKLTSKTEFERYIKRDFSVVAFCGKHCSACNRFVNEMEYYEEFIKESIPFVRIAEIDCSTIPELTKDIEFVPTIKIYHGGENYTISIGFLTASKLVDWIKDFVKLNEFEIPETVSTK